MKLIHVIPKRRLTPKRGKQFIGNSLKKLRALVPNQAKALGIATEMELAESPDTAKAICQAAERFGADVICMGTHGRSGISAAILGSVAKSVMATSTRPIFTVPAAKG